MNDSLQFCKVYHSVKILLKGRIKKLTSCQQLTREIIEVQGK